MKQKNLKVKNKIKSKKESMLNSIKKEKRKKVLNLFMLGSFATSSIVFCLSSATNINNRSNETNNLNNKNNEPKNIYFTFSNKKNFSEKEFLLTIKERLEKNQNAKQVSELDWLLNPTIKLSIESGKAKNGWEIDDSKSKTIFDINQFYSNSEHSNQYEYDINIVREHWNKLNDYSNKTYKNNSFNLNNPNVFNLINNAINSKRNLNLEFFNEKFSYDFFSKKQGTFLKEYDKNVNVYEWNIKEGPWVETQNATIFSNLNPLTNIQSLKKNKINNLVNIHKNISFYFDRLKNKEEIMVIPSKKKYFDNLAKMGVLTNVLKEIYKNDSLPYADEDVLRLLKQDEWSYITPEWYGNYYFHQEVKNNQSKHNNIISLLLLNKFITDKDKFTIFDDNFISPITKNELIDIFKSNDFKEWVNMRDGWWFWEKNRTKFWIDIKKAKNVSYRLPGKESGYGTSVERLNLGNVKDELNDDDRYQHLISPEQWYDDFFHNWNSRYKYDASYVKQENVFKENVNDDFKLLTTFKIANGNKPNKIYNSIKSFEIPTFKNVNYKNLFVINNNKTTTSFNNGSVWKGKTQDTRPKFSIGLNMPLMHAFYTKSYLVDFYKNMKLHAISNEQFYKNPEYKRVFENQFVEYIKLFNGFLFNGMKG